MSKITEWEAIEDILDAVKVLVDSRRNEDNQNIEDIYAYLVWASDKAYMELKKLRKEASDD